MTRTVGKGTSGGWEDGQRNEEGAVDYLLEYSPYHNVQAQLYPAMLVTTSDHDDRVVPLHTYKYLAELQYTAGPNVISGQRPLMARI